jgi:hypothetical protein
MGLSVSALNELRRELAELRRTRETLDSRIQGIELIVSSERAQAQRSGDAVPVAPATSRPRQSKGGSQVSLRTRVLETLRRVPGSNSAEVVQLLEGEGFRVSGVTSLRNRVSHEISRLGRLGMVRRERDGLYVTNVGETQSQSDIAVAV